MSDLDSDGYRIVPGVLDSATATQLIEALGASQMARSTRGAAVFGGRNLLAVDAVKETARSSSVLSLARKFAGDRARAVRAIFFDKTPGANWPVVWHQDLTLAVAERHDLPGWSRWSVKAGVQHVQPPTALLERMVTLRLHLDDCGEDNGPLRVLPGTHRLGRLPHARIAELRGEITEEICIAPLGSALVMRPLLLHASSAAANPRHRRVLHLEFAGENLLPAPLRWAA